VDQPGDALDVAIERARAGDPRGFDTLFRALAGPVAGYLRARSVSDPEGITNDVFLRAFRAIHTFKGDSARFRSWLFTIAHNAALDDVRRRHRRAPESPLAPAHEQPGGDVEAEVMATLAHDRVHALLDGLSPDQRDVLVLRIVADLSIEQVAAVLGKGYEAVRALQRRGLASVLRAISAQEAVRR
jgi:RNA polymerase sigma-70 factor (ECF subfamily)